MSKGTSEKIINDSIDFLKKFLEYIIQKLILKFLEASPGRISQKFHRRLFDEIAIDFFFLKILGNKSMEKESHEGFSKLVICKIFGETFEEFPNEIHGVFFFISLYA